MFPFPLPPGSSEPIEIDAGITIVGYQRMVTVLVPELEAVLAGAGWTTETSGGAHMGGMWIVNARNDSEQWTLTAMGVDDSAQLSITRDET